MSNQPASPKEITDTLTEKPKERLWVRFLGSLLFGPSKLVPAVVVLVFGPTLIHAISYIVFISNLSEVCGRSFQCHLAFDIANFRHVLTALVHPVTTLHQIPGLATVPFLVGVICFYIYLAITAIYLFRETWNLGRVTTRSIGKVAQRLKAI